MAGNGKRVIQSCGFCSCMGADCQATTSKRYVAVYPLDFVVVKAICRRSEDPGDFIPLFEGVLGSGKQRIIGRYAGTVFDGYQSHVDFFEHYF